MNAKSKRSFGLGIGLTIVLGILLVSSAIAQTIIDTAHGDIINNAPVGKESSSTVSNDFTQPLPQGPDVDLVKSIVENGWKLRLEAGLDRNRGQELDYKKQLSQYYSAMPNTGAKSVDVDKSMEAIPEVPPEKANQVQSQPFQFVGPEAAELERAGNYIDFGRYNEKLANFRVMNFGVDSLAYLKISIKDSQAEVVVDIKYWSEFIHTNPDGTEVKSVPHGGERHTFLLAYEQAGWRITSDTFTILPGFEP